MRRKRGVVFDRIFYLSFSAFRRVHITKATLLELGGKFEVEDGKGRERDEVLAKLNIDTFLIIPPKQQVKLFGDLNMSFFQICISKY